MEFVASTVWGLNEVLQRVTFFTDDMNGESKICARYRVSYLR